MRTEQQWGSITNFNPRPLCRGRPDFLPSLSATMQFQSTPPMQGATSGVFYRRYVLGISIHAPYAGGDLYGMSPPSSACYFNPRPLCRGRPPGTEPGQSRFGFQSTPPMQGATHYDLASCRLQFQFQSTPPMQGATGHFFKHHVCLSHFNPRPLCRGRPGLKCACP